MTLWMVMCIDALFYFYGKSGANRRINTIHPYQKTNKIRRDENERQSVWCSAACRT